MSIDTAAASAEVADPVQAAEVVPEGQQNLVGEDPMGYLFPVEGFTADASAGDVSTAAGGFDAGPTAGLPPDAQASDIGSKIIRAAQQYLGTPYQWGGTGGGGIDCSGLVQAAYKSVGINLPRISFQQANNGQRVPMSRLRPGDLVAWDNSSRNDGADHIAVYLGNGMIIEAARPGTNVRSRKLGRNEGAWGVRMGWS